MKFSVRRLILCLVLLAFAVQIVRAIVIAQNPRQFEGISLDATVHSEVFFRNAEQSVDLAGLLFLPEGDGPFAGAVIAHGSGTSSRSNRWYLTLTHHLQRNGIAVLLPDKRGSEKSGGDWRTADFYDLASDTAAAVDYFRNASGVPLCHVGIIGMSQGGHYAALAAQQSGDLDFVVNLVGSAVMPREQLQFEEDHNLRQMGIPPGLSYLVALGSTAHIRHVRRPEFWDAVGNFDPIPLWRNLDIPALVLYGSDDTNVPTRESVRRLEALDHPLLTVQVFEGSGHALEDPPGMGNSIFRADALSAISDFIFSVTSQNP